MSPKVWLITGASSGFGRDMTEHVLRNGDKVVATLRKPEALADLSSQYSDQLLVLKLDVTQQDEVVRTFAEAKKKFGRVDVVFNNAGFTIFGELESVPDEVARSLFDVNFWGAVYVTREAIRFFREDNPPGLGGRLLQHGSASGIQSTLALSFYGATKFALEGFTEAVVQELDPDWNIKIILLQPSRFHTNISTTSCIITPPHPAYANGKSRVATMRQIADKGEIPMPNDTKKGVAAYMQIASMDDPPFRFPLGENAIQSLRNKAAEYQRVADDYEAWSADLARN